jgi:hypothetical protein
MFDPANLPAAPQITVRCEPDYYGASHIIAAGLGLPSAPTSRSSWVHGCDLRPIPRAFFVPHFPNATQTHLVSNLAHQALWREHGYPLSVAVGCPFIYTEPSGAARIEGSTLLMPNHLLAESTGGMEQVIAWLEEMAEKTRHVETVAVCIYQGDVATLAPVAERLGLLWFSGAAHDTLSLPRIRAMFDHFEYVFTNGNGSHVPYAAWAGCKVALTPPYYRVELGHLDKHPRFVKYPDLLKNMASGLPENLVQRFPFLFPSAATEATCPREWAGEVLGADSKRPLPELARLLGWKWRADDPAFATKSYEEAAMLLGASNPTEEDTKWQKRLDDAKQQAKAASSKLKQATKRLDEGERFSQSISGRIGRVLYSLEKRLFRR